MMLNGVYTFATWLNRVSAALLSDETANAFRKRQFPALHKSQPDMAQWRVA